MNRKFLVIERGYEYIVEADSFQVREGVLTIELNCRTILAVAPGVWAKILEADIPLGAKP